MILEKAIPYSVLYDALVAYEKQTGNGNGENCISATIAFADGNTRHLRECEANSNDTVNISKINYFKKFHDGAAAGLEIQGNIDDAAIKIRLFRQWDSDGHEFFVTAIADTLKKLGLPVKDSYVVYGPTEPEVIDGW